MLRQCLYLFHSHNIVYVFECRKLPVLVIKITVPHSQTVHILFNYTYDVCTSRGIYICIRVGTRNTFLTCICALICRVPNEY